MYTSKIIKSTVTYFIFRILFIYLSVRFVLRFFFCICQRNTLRRVQLITNYIFAGWKYEREKKSYAIEWNQKALNLKHNRKKETQTHWRLSTVHYELCARVVGCICTFHFSKTVKMEPNRRNALPKCICLHIVTHQHRRQQTRTNNKYL